MKHNNTGHLWPSVPHRLGTNIRYKRSKRSSKAKARQHGLLISRFVPDVVSLGFFHRRCTSERYFVLDCTEDGEIQRKHQKRKAAHSLSHSCLVCWKLYHSLSPAINCAWSSNFIAFLTGDRHQGHKGVPTVNNCALSSWNNASLHTATQLETKERSAALIGTKAPCRRRGGKQLHDSGKALLYTQRSSHHASTRLAAMWRPLDSGEKACPS